MSDPHEQQAREMLALEEAAKDAAAKALMAKWQTRQFGQHAGYLTASEIVDIVLDAAIRALPDAQPAAPSNEELRIKQAFNEGREFEAGMRAAQPAPVAAQPFAGTPCPGCNSDRANGPCCDDCMYRCAPRSPVAQPAEQAPDAKET